MSDCGEDNYKYCTKGKYIYTTDKIDVLDKIDVFDKIKAEIKSLSNVNPSYWHSGDMVDRDDVFDIIDKYKRSEEEECINN